MVQEGECQLDIPNLGEMGEHLRGEAQWWLTATGTTSSAGNCYSNPLGITQEPPRGGGVASAPAYKKNIERWLEQKIAQMTYLEVRCLQ
jgi:hypothetical protein